jgi:hypothetical protein
MTAWIQLFLDVPAASFETAVSFWASATGCTTSERRGEDGQFLTLQPAVGTGWVKMQAVDGPGGVHLDLDSADRPASIQHARSLGATTAWIYEDVEVMRSPGGFVFCQTLVDGSPVLSRDGRTVLDQVCLDVPAEHWERETAFWRDLTGRTLESGSVPGFARLAADGQVRILLQKLGEPTGVVRGHPDFASADREADTERHVELGARVVAIHDRWTVLTAPGGQVYCLTDRDPMTGSVAL